MSDQFARVALRVNGFAREIIGPVQGSALVPLIPSTMHLVLNGRCEHRASGGFSSRLIALARDDGNMNMAAAKHVEEWAQC
jgi:hypothetical protein